MVSADEPKEMAGKLLGPGILALALKRGDAVVPFGGDLEAGDRVEVLQTTA